MQQCWDPLIGVRKSVLLMMRHKKTMHMEKVSICWPFVSVTCIFGDQNCWFSHSKSSNEHEPENFQCTSCEKEFRYLIDCLSHRKQDHNQVVPSCRNETNGSCKFGNKRCWFKHNNPENSSKVEKENGMRENKNEKDQ